MAGTVAKLPVKTESKTKEAAVVPKEAARHPFETLRHEIDRVFEDFNRGTWRSPFSRMPFDVEPFWRHELSWGAMPAVDIVEKDKQYEIEAELPGMDEKNIEISLSDGMLTLKGEKSEEKEEKKKNCYLSERHYGSFQRAFRIPVGVDADRIEASFAKGVLKVTLPKTAEVQKREKKVEIKAG
ncbi:MAG: Hsp20/alpha crystallin family protein [Sinimarinibacterium sp.]|jgi:HSP20 family protein